MPIYPTPVAEVFGFSKPKEDAIETFLAEALPVGMPCRRSRVGGRRQEFVRARFQTRGRIIFLCRRREWYRQVRAVARELAKYHHPQPAHLLKEFNRWYFGIDT